MGTMYVIQLKLKHYLFRVQLDYQYKSVFWETGMIGDSFLAFSTMTFGTETSVSLLFWEIDIDMAIKDSYCVR